MKTTTDSDKRIVYEMGTTSASYTIMSASDYGTIHAFGQKAGIINTLNYMTVISRLRQALSTLYLEGKCERLRSGNSYSYSFIKSLRSNL